MQILSMSQKAWLNPNQSACQRRISITNSSVDTLSVRFSSDMAINADERRAQDFINRHTENIHPLIVAMNEAEWALDCQGSQYVEPGHSQANQARMEGAEHAYKDYVMNREAFQAARALLQQKDQIRDPRLLRQIEALYRGFENSGHFYPGFEDANKASSLLNLEKQVVDRSFELAGIHNSYRGTIGGEVIGNMAIRQRLEMSNDAKESRQLWLARNSHGLMTLPAPAEGQTLAQALQKLVVLRNTMAQKNLYSDYYAMKLDKLNISDDQLVSLLDQVEQVTQEPFHKLQNALNLFSQQRYGIAQDEANDPWIGSGNLKRMFDFNLQPFLTGKNPLQLLQATAQLMGEDLQPMFEKSIYVKQGEQRSSIYFDPKKDAGKNQHWFTFPIDPPTDVRIFGSVEPTHQVMMDTAIQILLHEALGHGLDRKCLPKELPFLLRRHHSITTESHAKLMENLMQDPQWLEKVVGLPVDEAKRVAAKGQQYYKADLLLGIRHMLAVIQFERQMYKKPEQNLSKLWWDLQEKYLNVRRPPDETFPAYAFVPHLFSHPVYYPNYFLAHIIRAQKLAYIKQQYGGLLNEGAGKYLRTQRMQGDIDNWDVLAEKATNQPLSAEALKKELEGLALLQ